MTSCDLLMVGSIVHAWQRLWAYTMMATNHNGHSNENVKN